MIARSWDGRVPRRHADGFHQHRLVTGVADSAKIAGGWSTPRRLDSAPWTTPSSSTTSRPAKASRNPPPSAARSPPPMLPCYSWVDGCDG